MAYTINLTNGTTFATIPDGTVNTSSSMILVGKNYAGYGEFLDENFIHLLENFSNPTAPPAPITGQLWWDSSNTLLKIWQGSAWKNVGAATASASAPSNNVTGDLWFDTSNQQLKVWTGLSFLVVGPAYSSITGTAGAIPETIIDGSAVPHIVTSIYVNNARVAIISQDAFAPAAPVNTSFPFIYTGITLSVSLADAATFSGNVVNVTGNVSGSYFNGVGISLSGNVVGNLNVSGNIAGSNLRTPGLVSATGNVTGGNIVTGGAVNATGNITGALISSSGAITATGNVTGGNLLTAGQISATGNITSAGNISGNYLFGNGSQLIGISAAVSVSKIENGTSNVSIGATGGNVSVQVAGTANVVVIDSTTLYSNIVGVGSIVKTGTNAVGNIGAVASQFGNVFAVQYNGTTLSLSGNVTAGNIGVGAVSATTVQASGNVSAANIVGTLNGSGANVTNINAGNISTGTVPTARLASGTANSSTYLRGDQTWAAINTATTITNDTSTNATYYPTFVTATSGSTSEVRVSSTKLNFNPSTGNLTLAGDVTAFSDERLKTDWTALPDNYVEQLSQVKHGTYTRTDTGVRQIGVSAQSLQPVAPEGVQTGEYLSVSYGHVALASAVELARRVVEQDRRIAQLESLVQQLIAKD